MYSVVSDPSGPDKKSRRREHSSSDTFDVCAYIYIVRFRYNNRDVV